MPCFYLISTGVMKQKGHLICSVLNKFSLAAIITRKTEFRYPWSSWGRESNSIQFIILLDSFDVNSVVSAMWDEVMIKVDDSCYLVCLLLPHSRISFWESRLTLQQGGAATWDSSYIVLGCLCFPVMCVWIVLLWFYTTMIA